MFNLPHSGMLESGGTVIWSLDGESHVLTAHLQLDTALDSNGQEEIKAEISNALEDFNFLHTTIEFEYPDEYCRDANEPEI